MRRTAALIVGGGPAGAAAAIALAGHGTRALLLERSREDEDALCGGFLSWRTLATLARLGVEPDALNRDRVVRARLFAGSRVREARLPRPALAVSRRRLDALLLARAAAVADVERGATARAAEGGGVVRLADGARLATDALFLATGKHDLRGLARPEEARGRDPTLGLRVRLAAHPRLAALVGDAIELHLFDRGYAGLVLQEDGTANLCLAVHRSRLAGEPPTALLRALAAEAPALGERLAYLRADAPIDAVANVPYGWRVRRGMAGLFRLGDQAGVIPSLAGEGMGIALASGLAAAAAHARGGAGASSTWQPRFARGLARPLAVAGLVRDLAESRAAPAAIAVMPPALVGLIARATRLDAGVCGAA